MSSEEPSPPLLPPFSLSGVVRKRSSQESDLSSTAAPSTVIRTPEFIAAAHDRGSSATAGTAPRTAVFGDHVSLASFMDDESRYESFRIPLRMTLRLLRGPNDEARVKSWLRRSFDIALGPMASESPLSPCCGFQDEVNLASDVGGIPGGVALDDSEMNRCLVDMYARAGRPHRESVLR